MGKNLEHHKTVRASERGIMEKRGATKLELARFDARTTKILEAVTSLEEAGIGHD